VAAAGTAREELTRRLSAAYGAGLLSEQTFALRVEEVLRGRLIDTRRLVGDLHPRAGEGGLRDRISNTMQTVLGRVERLLAGRGEQPLLLALDWAGGQSELVIGRSLRCDIVLSDGTVSRLHAGLRFRESRWVIQDLASTNGTLLNGRRVGRCELRAGDELLLGDVRLLVD
jgi:hypothetical protein